MRCDDARDLLLEADVRELLGAGPSELATHVRQCPACADLSQRILDGQAALSGALARMADKVAPDTDAVRARDLVVELPARAGATEGSGDEGSVSTRLSSGVGPPAKRRVVWRVALPMAAAAAATLALFQLPGREAARAPFDVPAEWAHLGTGPGATGAVASASPETDVAVLPTQNPDITVVWFIR